MRPARPGSLTDDRPVGRVGRPIVLVADGTPLVAALDLALQRESCDVRTTVGSDTALVRASCAGSAEGVAVLDLSGELTPGGFDTLSLVRTLARAGWTVLVAGDPCRDDARIAAAVHRGASGVLSVAGPFGSCLHTILYAAGGGEVMTGPERRRWSDRYRRGLVAL